MSPVGVGCSCCTAHLPQEQCLGGGGGRRIQPLMWCCRQLTTCHFVKADCLSAHPHCCRGCCRRCAASGVAAPWTCHPAQLLLQLHATLVNPQDLPPGCHCPSAAAAAAAAGGGGGDGEQHGGGGCSRPNSAGGWPNMAAAGCAACDAALQLLLGARQLLIFSAGAAGQSSGNTPASHATPRINHSSTASVQGQSGGGSDLLGLVKSE